ncbi:17309_t:CDS:2, partial [Cetraspora pellucida]
NQLKPQFEVDVGDETLQEVHDTISNYSSVLSLYNGNVSEYEKSEEYKYLVNRETLRQYREYEC